MKIVIIDDDRLVAASLKTIAGAAGDITVAALGHSGEEAVSLYELHQPDILLMDIRMQGITGIQAAERILQTDPAAKILFLTTFSDDAYIADALRIGAKGYILKQHFESIVPALRAVELGQSVFGDEVVSKLPEILSSGQRQAAKGPEDFGLSEREGTVVELVAQGLSNREIAGRLFLSEGTIRNYISAALEKLSLRDRTQLAIFYYQKWDSRRGGAMGAENS